MMARPRPLPRARHQRDPRLGTRATSPPPSTTSAAYQPELVSHDALAQLSPVGHAHVNPAGRYRFDITGPPPEGRLRPLHEPPAADEQPVRPSPPILLNGDKY